MKKLSYLFAILLFAACSQAPKEPITLTILHTNDTHSQVEPLQKNDLGGYARRMGYIAKEREADPELLHIDAGDYWQGTPFFNFFNGRVEIDAMNRMGYDVATLGNHEFDNGVDTLAAVLRTAKFPIVCANYGIEGTVLEDVVKPYTIINKKGVKIGIIGVGCSPESLISDQNFAPLKWEDPVPVANRLAHKLRHQKHCDLIIVVSHLGTMADHGGDSEICDTYLASHSRDIDIIIGGHTHQRYDNLRVQNLDGKDVLLSQMAKSGIYVGKMTVVVE